MRSHVIVIGRIGFEDPAQVRLAEHTIKWSRVSRRIDSINVPFFKLNSTKPDFGFDKRLLMHQEMRQTFMT